MCRLLESVRGKTMGNTCLIPAAIAGLAMTTLTANATPTGSILAKPEASVIVQVAEHECIRDEKGMALHGEGASPQLPTQASRRKGLGMAMRGKALWLVARKGEALE